MRAMPAPSAAALPAPAAGLRHLAIIMDGNGRWAKQRLLPRVVGHTRGIDAVRATTRAARDLGIEALTLYAFSSENWRRPADEVADLMNLLRRFLRSDLEEIHAANARLQVIGDYRALESDLVRSIDDAVALTAGNNGSTLCIGLNYGAQDEILRAVRRLAGEGADLATLDAERLESALDTAGLPPVDLLIRTSGEQRLSNFLLWQCAYAELLFTDVLWPDFGRAELEQAISNFGALIFNLFYAYRIARLAAAVPPGQAAGLVALDFVLMLLASALVARI